MMKLIGSLTSPFVRKVRIVMAEKKIDYEFELDDVWSDSVQVGQVNPLGKVPCLVMEDNSAVFDSRVIVEYLDTLTPVCKLLPANTRERIEVKCWEALADGLLDAAVLIRLESTLRDPSQRSDAWLARQRLKIDASLIAMTQSLAEKPWCMDKQYSLADVAVGCALGYIDFRFPEIPWRAEHPRLVKLFDKLSQRLSFIDTCPPAA